MIRLDLAEVELDNIAEVLDDPDIAPQFKNRLLIVMMPREGVQHGVVARCLKVNADTVTNTLKLYQSEGLQGVVEHRHYQPSSSLAPFWQCLKCSCQVAPAAKAKQAMQRSKQLTGIRLSES